MQWSNVTRIKQENSAYKAEPGAEAGSEAALNIRYLSEAALNTRASDLTGCPIWTGESNKVHWRWFYNERHLCYQVKCILGEKWVSSWDVIQVKCNFPLNAVLNAFFTLRKTRGQWPCRVASNRAMKMASDLKPATSITLDSTCILLLKVTVMASKAL